MSNATAEFPLPTAEDIARLRDEIDGLRGVGLASDLTDHDSDVAAAGRVPSGLATLPPTWADASFDALPPAWLPDRDTLGTRVDQALAPLIVATAPAVLSTTAVATAHATAYAARVTGVAKDVTERVSDMTDHAAERLQPLADRAVERMKPLTDRTSTWSERTRWIALATVWMVALAITVPVAIWGLAGATSLELDLFGDLTEIPASQTAVPSAATATDAG